ncbi:uncharacterized protein LOC131956530 [Physella acuta]|uniref:uncharacterized protein LOC131956530 n=1 Tax=Physella acuta TaxID=109671 RepID=UPI0027DE974E|nr:uncharacterized protein LOC131956530 [Physella acuta]
MAEPESLIARAGIVRGRKNSVPKLLQSIQMDTIKIKQITSDKLAMPLLRQMKKNKPTLMLPNERKLRLDRQRRALSVTGLDRVNSSISASIVEHRKLIKAKLENNNTIWHGFRYHSNGDERQPRTKSLPSFVSEKPKFSAPSSAIYGFVQNPSKIGIAPLADLRVQKFQREFMEDIMRSGNSGILAQHRSLYARPSAPFAPNRWRTMSEPVASKIVEKDSRGGNSGLQQANNSFNMRYGVTSQLFALRKPALEECKKQELEIMNRTQKSVDSFINNIAKMKKKKTAEELSEDGAIIAEIHKRISQT